MLVKSILSVYLFATALTAAPLLSPQPLNQVISGTPGATVGWGLTVDPDPNEWVTFIGSIVLSETDPAGSYMDYVGGLGGPAGFYLPPDNGTWTVPFHALTQQGLGAYAIDALAAPNMTSDLVVRVLYERYTDDPNICLDCFAGIGEIDVNLSVQVVQPAAVPEPSTLLAVAACGLMLLGRASTGRAARVSSDFARGRSDCYILPFRKKIWQHRKWSGKTAVSARRRVATHGGFRPCWSCWGWARFWCMPTGPRGRATTIPTAPTSRRSIRRKSGAIRRTRCSGRSLRGIRVSCRFLRHC